MNIAGVGLEQDVAMKNVDMKIGPVTGAAGMAGSAASPHLLYFVILSVFRAVYGSIFGRLQAVGRYVRHPQGRCADRPPVLLLQTLFLALAFVFFNAAGAMAQLCEENSPLPMCMDSTPPDGNFEAGWPTTHDGMTPFEMAIIFTEEVFGFAAEDIVFAALNNSQPAGSDFQNYRPRVSNPMVDPDNSLRYTFTVTPVTHTDGISIDFSVTVGSETYEDGSGNENSDAVDDNVSIMYLAPLVAHAGADKSVASEGEVTLDGSGSSQTDSSRTVTYLWTQTVGTGGTLADADKATARFTAPALNPGAADATHTFTLTVMDNQGSAAVTDTVLITVNAPAANVDPVAEAGDPQRRVTGGLVTLDGSGSMDPDALVGETLDYSWLRATGAGKGSGGTVTLSDPTDEQPTFTAPTPNAGAADVTYGFTLTVTDADGVESEPDTVTITINAPPLAEAGEYAVWDSGALVTFDGSDSFDTTGTWTYNWVETPAGNVTLMDAKTDTPSFQADPVTPGTADVEYVFTLTVTDADGVESEPDTATITINAPPKAEAGDPRIVPSGESVMLDGGDSSDMTGTLNYDWERTGGTGDANKVTWTGEDSAELTVTPTDTVATQADAVTHIFTLTVTDAQGETAEDTVTVTVEEPLVALAATVDPTFEVEAGTAETISGTAMIDRRRGPATYSWARTGGDGDASKVTLTGQNTASLGFTAETRDPGAANVTHVYRLTVTDKDGETATADTTITVVSPTVGLVANAGMHTTVASGTTPVTLDGNGSTGDDRAELSYAWERTGGTGDASTVTLTGKDTATPSFTAETLADLAASVTHIFTLTVTDDRGSTADTDTVEITVIADLVAHAGTNRTVGSGATVLLDGRLSTVSDSGRDVTYAWARTSGTGDSSLVPSDPAARETSFTAETLTAGNPSVTHIFTLTVTDDQNTPEATDTVEITVTAPLAPLVAHAGADKSVASEGEVTLDGSGSTQTDSTRTVIYAWTQTGGTGGTLADADKATARFTAPALNPGAADATHTFTLRVTDNQGSDAVTDTVEITVTAPLAPLVANAGADKSVASEATVTLDGSGSTQTDSTRTVIYAWTQTGGDAATVTLIGANTLQPTFTAQTLNPGDADVTYEFTLTVSDNQSSAPATDTVTVTVTAVSVDIVVSPSDLKVQEGGSGTYRVRLRESPGREVIIMADSGNEPVVRLKNTRLVFNADNWNDWQEVEIDAVADSVKKGDSIEVTIRHSLNGVASNKFAVVTVSVRAQEDDPILDHVGQFIATRATTLLGQQPDLIHFLKQDGLTQDSGGSFTFQATDGRLSLDGGFIHDGTWGEVTGARTNSESTDTKSVLGSFGIHRKYSETFLTGLMLQFDRADHELPQQTGTIDGTGWLVGPYFVARHGSQPLYFEGRLLYGYSDNDIRFMDRHLGARTGSFDSTRVLAQIRVEGEIAVPGWDHGDDGGAEVPQLIPYADLRWLEDRAAAFTTVSATTGFRVPVPGQTVNISQLELGSNMVVPVAVPTGSMILTGGLGLVFSNTEGNHIKSVARGRGRGEIGFSYGLDENVQIDFESFYDGIGSSGYEGYGLSLNAEMRF